MSLSSLIVQREIATIRQVEEALARQVLYGGDLVTNLLEVAKLDEGTLTLLLAESFGIQAATLGPLPEDTLVEALDYIRQTGLGVENRMAVVTHPDDEVRTERMQSVEGLAHRLGMHLRGFEDYAEALEWLNEPTGGP